ncbi:uncharacterized protein LOC126736650 isoform X2 [Anthonomus grandis grandis]|uniref:uncharacterized protein LOC126736650 isoform X2 n=1 Tax=Anthonomus grandis grandis TaxID=2921223 RepID=UPI0021667E8C|nr:uncharacterized protein LOC126736650 isoform X2 [Anthonomus grandis grandis]
MMWIILLSALVSISLVSFLMLCICWKDKTPKNTITNSRRSLPDIPSEMAAGITWDANGDNSSEHYATLGQYQNQNKAASSNRPNVRTSISQHSSISQADDTFSPYERVKYDKIKSKLEHPYAQVQPANSRPAVNEENLASIEERVTLLRVDNIPSISANSSTPSRSRRSSAHSNEPADIPAATAVAGGIAASYELPYMTPPINFSGDSQDSSKGYTSISVREPLANIMAETNAVTNKQKRKLDVHYSTVSDDSDDVYTTIPDPNNPIYTSESETYARIPPLPITVEAEINIPPAERASDDREEVDALYEPPPQPVASSSDALKHVTSHSHTHSRQASSSSSANFGSPKPEKRQANSPLPPPPPDPVNTDFFSEKLQVKRNLDDLYAKVHKTKKDDVNDDGSEKSSLNGSTKGSIPIAVISEESADHNYETLKKNSTTNSDFGYEKIKGLDCEPGYASINGPPSLAASSDPGYEALNQVSMQAGPNYEELRRSLPEPSSAGYSVVNKKKKVASEPPEDPNYEQVPENPIDPNYAAVKSSGSESDPNYESVNRPDPNYETLREPHSGEKSNSLSRTDSGSVGYEKVKSTTSESSNSASRTTDSEPPYEQLRNEFDSDNVTGYEKVGSSGSSGNEVEPIQNEEFEVVLNIHDENAVVQV